ncbi:MAG: hypothetical protein K2H45_04395 [Acetatifactor sp.]|nr:hypothetical protein [Acetatifactor sp.]
MSFSVCARIKEKCISEELLEKAIADFFQPPKDILVRRDGMRATYEGIDEDGVTVIYFNSDSRSPYNIYVSEITGGKFEYMQSINLDIGKETATVDRFAKMISFCIYLYGKVKSEILVTSDVHDDICLVKAGEILWSQTLSFDYKSLVMSQR